MSDNEEYPDINYGIDDAYSDSFKKRNESDDEHNIESPSKEKKPMDIDNFSMQKYEKNPKVKKIGHNEEEGGLDDLLDLINDEDSINEEKNQNNNDNSGLDDLLNLMSGDDEKTENDPSQRKKVLITKSAANKNKQQVKKDNPVQNPTTKNESKSVLSTKSSITISKAPSSSDTDEPLFTEKNTGLRLIKAPFKNEIEMNMRVMSDSGSFFKLSDVNRRACELKESGGNLKWYSVFVLGSKSETKCSAKGNNYVIWRIFDSANLDKQQEISLFLFGAAYKTHWKSSNFEAFALLGPDILDSKPNNSASSNNNSNNSYFNSSAHTGSKKPGNYSSPSGWNSFANKKVDLNNKLTLSIKSDFQLIPLGIAKDITNCQSNTTNKPETNDPSKRCKNIVNLQEAPFCIYHCKQHDKANNPANPGKYSMNKPAGQLNRFGTNSLFKSTITPDMKLTPAHVYTPPKDFVENLDGSKFVPNGRLSAMKKVSELEQRKKVVKEMKSEILNSLTASISTTINPVIGTLGKSKKKSDQELLALFDGKQLDKDAITKIRIDQNAAGIRQTDGNPKMNKEMANLFSSKVLLPSEKTANHTITSQKMLEYKKNQSSIVLNDTEYAAVVKKNYNDKKANFQLAGMTSHKDICKSIKDKKEKAEKAKKKGEKEGEKDSDDDEEEAEEIVPVEKPKPKTNSIVASSFLKRRFEEIKQSKKKENAPKLSQAADSGFDLDLFIGDSKTTKKLLDVNNKYINHSPKTATSAGYKRKLQELQSPPQAKCNTPNKPNEGIEEKKAKKSKLLDDILKIKSNHAKEANDPEKNPHLKTYFDKLQVQENIDNKLSSTKNREVRSVTCKTCNYTSFSQSDYCRKLQHSISRQMSIQRFFKCKICNNKMHTLDKLYPSGSCAQCGNNMFESCGMKEQDISINRTAESSGIDQASEMYLTCGTD